MTSERKIKANRANARVSTGPKTRHGRVRSAKNALRHGLSVPVESDPALREQVQALASQIAGPNANAHIQLLARQVAEAQVDLRRVRDVRHQFLSHKLNNPHYDSRAHTREKVAVLFKLLRPDAPDIPTATMKNFLNTRPQGPLKLATILSKETKQLLSLDRYERRALSRRKFVVRALDLTRRNQRLY